MLGTPVLSWNKSGNVGIGTTGPNAKLEVAGDIMFGSTTNTGRIKSNGTDTLLDAIPSGGAIIFRPGGSVEAMRINNLGNVGIGTTAPLSKLEVNGVAAFSLGTALLPSHSFSGDLNTGMWSSGADTINFSANGAEKVRIQSDGNVGIGTTGPGAKLDVQSTSTTSINLANFIAPNLLSTNFSEIRIGQSLSNGNAVELRSYYQGDNSATNRFDVGTYGVSAPMMSILNSGNVGIGTTNPTHLIMLSGGAYSDGTNWSNGSDRNSKENFTTLDPQSVLEKIATLPITQWNYKVEPNATMHIGPMAQDFYSAFGLGGISGNTSISTIDPSGVALLGIQALNTKTNNFITQSSTQIAGLTENQNKIVNQLTGQLADQTLSVDNKLQLIGASLDELTTKQIATLKDQITAQKSDISDLKDQIKLLQDETKSVIDFQIAFNLCNIIIKDALGNINLLGGKITAKDIEALGTVKADTLDGQKLKLGAQISGTSSIKAGELESAKILTTEAQAGIKLYITPKGSTQGKTLFYDESDIDSGVGFKVKIDAPALDKAVEFNWLIVK